MSLASGVASLALAIGNPAFAQSAGGRSTDGQSADGSPVTTAQPVGAANSEMIVVGIRRSVESATEKKRRAKQIVDSVVAEDVGKLPDTNVPEAISRIPGVQITRERGQGQSVAIRGLEGVQTTINGNNVNLGVDRSINLSDVPAELLKAVDVYKTRSPDQIEGSIAGTVNIQLRRPLELEKGWTLAGSARGAYNDIVKKTSPFLSILAARRFDLGDGEAGLMVNASRSRNFYRETYIDSESPDSICCGTPESPAGDTTLARLPVNTYGTYSSVSYRVVFDPDRREVVEPSNGRGNFVDVLPSATAILHFTPKVQLRLSYSTNVQRVDFYELRPFFYVDPSSDQPTVDAGNPDLRAQRDQAFDVSAEYYFGQGGLLSLAGFYKKASNFLYFSREPVDDLSVYGLRAAAGSSARPATPATASSPVSRARRRPRSASCRASFATWVPASTPAIC